MLKLKLTKNDKVDCPLMNTHVKKSTCLVCPDLFGFGFNYVNCKRGHKKDEYLKKEGNRLKNRKV